MAKRKKAKSRKKSPQAKRPGGAKRAAGTRATLETHGQHPGPSSALTPAPALPGATRGGRRERETRGEKSTFSVHELLAEVPQPPRPKAASPRPKPAPRTAPSGELSQSQIYETLAALLVPYARKMESEMHPKIGFCLKAKSARTGRETHFGAVQALPDGVAFHLFPLYAHPDLLENVTPELFTRMRGKTCFHFESLHAGLLAELAELTHAGFERFLSDGVF